MFTRLGETARLRQDAKAPCSGYVGSREDKPANIKLSMRTDALVQTQQTGRHYRDTLSQVETTHMVAGLAIVPRHIAVLI
jgi:type II secretory pathway component HofQ